MQPAPSATTSCRARHRTSRCEAPRQGLASPSMSVKTHVLHSPTLPRYLAMLRGAGGDVRSLLALHGLPADAPDAASVDVPLPVFHALSEEIARRLPDAFLGLSLAKAIPPAAFGVVELSARSAPSFQAAAQ